MLKDSIVTPMIPVEDLERARHFYSDILGLEQIDQHDSEVITYRSGSSQLHVYRSEFAGTNRATAMTFEVGGDIEDIVRGLKAKGVRFEHYDAPGLIEQEQGLYVSEATVGHSAIGRESESESESEGEPLMKVAWFKDPDGNILSIAHQAELATGDDSGTDTDLDEPRSANDLLRSA